MRTKVIMAMLIALVAVQVRAADIPDFSKYIWEYPVVSKIELPSDKQWLVDDLRTESDKILAAGHLAPYYFNAGDLHHEGYFLYVAPGRIITTLAWAYPHLTPEQQAKVKQYVAKELANPKYAPWAGAKLPWDEGAGREGLGKPAGFNFDRWWGMEGQRRPYLHTLYGLWLYGQRSGDWGIIQQHWAEIKKFYSANSAKAEIYGEFGAHIAIARLARQFGDAAMAKEAVGNASKCFAHGLDYAATEKTSLKYFNRLKEQHHNVIGSTNFMLMNLTPEVGRYLRENLKEVVIAKNEAIKKSFPHWWFIAPPYASWAGNIGPDCEANGLPREIFGMIYPAERWVNESAAQTLAGYMTSGADGIGDCFWLEGLAQTIDVYGQTRWEKIP
jgi:hypothetical protein